MILLTLQAPCVALNGVLCWTSICQRSLRPVLPRREAAKNRNATGPEFERERDLSKKVRPVKGGLHFQAVEKRKKNKAPMPLPGTLAKLRVLEFFF